MGRRHRRRSDQRRARAGLFLAFRRRPGGLPGGAQLEEEEVMTGKSFLRNGMLGIAILASAGVSRAQIGYVDADTLVSSANATTNFGNIPQIPVGTGNSMLVRFNFLPPTRPPSTGPSNATIVTII